VIYVQILTRKLAYLSLTKPTAFIFICCLLTACVNTHNTVQTEVQPEIQESPAAEPVSKISRNLTTDLPEVISSAVLKDASKRAGKSIDELEIIGYESRTWKDGCLGIAKPGIICTQTLVSGWEVKVSNQKLQTWVYRTNNSGSLVKLDSVIMHQNSSLSTCGDECIPTYSQKFSF
jgi:hypothetical protein